jgi:peroxiredoxin Q/BCP
MNAYRDQYASLFRGGRDIVLIAISPDEPEELRSWAKDDDFPFLFASDPEGATYAAYGGTPRENGMPGGRSLVLVGPDGRIGEVVPRFREVDPTAYEELQAIIDRIAPVPAEEAK